MSDLSELSDEETWSEFNQSAHTLIENSYVENHRKTIDNEKVLYSVENREVIDDDMSKSDFTVEKLKGSENFHDWNFAMENYLALKGYTNCIIAAESTTSEPVPPHTAVEKDSAKLAAAKAILVLSLESNLFPHVRKCKSALEVWHTIQELFEDRGHFRRKELLRKLVTCNLESCDSMATYVATIMTTLSKLENIGLPVDDDWSVTFLLLGLSEEYKPFVMGLRANSKVTCDEIKMQLLETEEAAEKGEALFSKSKQKKKKQFQKKRKCFSCNSTTHLSKQCPQQNKKEEKKNANANNAFCAFTAATDSDVWYIDSGASHHMTPNASILKDKEKCDIGHIVAANNSKIPVESTGTTIINASDTEIAVKKVLHVPGLAANLLSVSKIVEQGNSVLFNKEGCLIKNAKNEIVTKCKPINGIYRLEVQNLCMAAKSNATAMDWHRKLAHVNIQTLMRMKNDTQYGISFENDEGAIKNCEVCAKGKQTRQKFTASTTECHEKLELIHSDLAGPMENVSYGGAKYMLTFIDDFSKMAFVYFLKEKSMVLDTFVEFKQMVENQTGNKIKIFRTDNGGEYCSRSFDAFCKANGVIHQLTAPHTPEQNGVAERMNRTIVEKARCLLFDADISMKAWAEACNMAVYIRNRVPTSSLNFKSPQEVWSGEKVNVSKMKLFGCDAMVHVPKAQRKKWSAKSIKMSFVGYDSKAKAYRCLNKNTGRVTISRDVIFHDMPVPKFRVEIDDGVNDSTEKTSEAAKSSEKRNNDAEAGGSNEHNSSTEADDHSETIQSSPTNNVLINDTLVTLGNNTANNDDFEDAQNSESGSSPDSDATVIDVGDETFRTRAMVDTDLTPRKGSRVRKPYIPFQLFSFALICTEPTNEVEALEGEESAHWKKAMDEEMASHRKNDTWQLTELPRNCKAIAGKWVFKRKTNSSGEITRYKARFVAKGFAQRYGRDYYETFSPVVRHATIRYLLALAVKNRMSIYQMDAETAFLQGDLHENVYMKQAQGYDDNSGRVYHLKKAVYGLKQASRMWNLKLNDILIKFNFNRSKTDPCVYCKKGIIIAVYVDDFLIFYHNKGDLLKLREMLHANFNMKDIGLATSCLGINIKQAADFIEIDQSHYVKQVLERFGMTDCKSAPTPSDVNQKLSVAMCTEENSLVGKVPYQELIGSLLYLSGATRPDIAFAVNDLSRFNDKHSEPHWKALKRILRYLKGTIDSKIKYKRSEENDMTAYSDADWGADVDKRRSCTGYVVKMSNGAVSWCSQRQSIVALSTTEAEYIALSSAVREVIWLQQLAKECDDGKQGIVVTYCDNQSAINLGESEAYRPRTKHIDIRFHHLREKVEKRIIQLEYVATNEMVADSLTKPVSKEKTEYCRSGMGIPAKID